MEFADRPVRGPGSGSRRRRLTAFLRGWHCYGWHAACPTTRSERRRSSARRPPGTDGAVETQSWQSG